VAQSDCAILSTNDPEVPAACQNSESFQRYAITGSITYTGTSWTNSYTQNIQQTVTYTNACVVAFHAQNDLFPAPPASIASCAQIAANQMTNGASTASCPYDSATTSCNCALTFTASGTAGDTYTLSGTNQYVNSQDPVGYPVSYCVKTTAGVTTLTLSQTNQEGYTFEHVLTLGGR
jgi:hypothetical protein